MSNDVRRIGNRIDKEIVREMHRSTKNIYNKNKIIKIKSHDKHVNYVLQREKKEFHKFKK